MLNWVSNQNDSFLNPRFSAEQYKSLMEILSEFEGEFRSHIFILTSGTTAQSIQDLKWVALGKEAFLVSAEAVNAHLESHRSDVWIHTLPDFHVGGLGIWARSFLTGARVVKLAGWEPAGFCKMISEESGSLTSLVPAQVFDLVSGEFQAPSSVRAVLVGGGALSPALYEKGRELGWPLLPTYGMSETCSQVATARLKGDGRLEVLPHLQLVEMQDGILGIQGRSLLTAYLYREKGQAVCMDPKVDGIFVSSDRGRLDGKYLSILGRSGDFIKIGGESVELGRLKDILDGLRIQLQLEADVAILAFPDERLGHVIHLVSDRKLNSDGASALIARFNSQVLAFERIRRHHSLDSLPRNALGKLNSAKCLEDVGQSGPGGRGSVR